MSPPKQGRGGGRSSGGAGGGRSSGGGGGRSSGGGSGRSSGGGGGRGGPKGPPRGRSKPGSRGVDRSGARVGAPNARPPRAGAKAKSDRGLGGEQVEGRQSVRELLLAGRRKALEVVFSSGLDDAPILDDIIDLADENKVPMREISRGKFDALTRTESSQGVLAMAQPVPEHDLDDLARAVDPITGQNPFLLLVDGVTDPGNLGALLRSAECAGVTGVVLPKHRAVHLSPTVTKAAAGAIEHLPMGLVAGLPAAITRLRELGVWVVGLDGAADDSLFDLNLAAEPVALVMGSEGKGLSRLVAQRCDSVVSIPLRGALGSLNVSAAGTLACYEVARRRR